MIARGRSAGAPGDRSIQTSSVDPPPISTTSSCSVRGLDTSGAQEMTASRASSSGAMISSSGRSRAGPASDEVAALRRGGRPRSPPAASGGRRASRSSSGRCAAPAPCAPSRRATAGPRLPARCPAGRSWKSCPRHETGCPLGGQSASGNCWCRGPAPHKAGSPRGSERLTVRPAGPAACPPRPCGIASASRGRSGVISALHLWLVSRVAARGGMRKRPMPVPGGTARG
jgi:hypothetical protein